MSDAAFTTPRLSVIVPLYQSATTIAETVRSALADEVEGDAEIIVVDDGSTDGGPRLVGEIVRRDSRVRIIHRPNGGLAAARNTGIHHARGTWLRFLDADDLAIDGSASRLLNFAEARGFTTVCGSQELIDEHSQDMGRTLPIRPGIDGTLGGADFLESNRCGVGTVLIRRDVLGAHRFDESLRVCEDWDLWARLTANGLCIGVLPGPPVKRYRVRRASLSKDFAGMLHVGRLVMSRAFDRARAMPTLAPQTSESHQRSAAARLALTWATMRAFADAEHRVTDAIEMFRFGSGGPFDADAAAEAAHWGAIVGLGLRPERPGLERDAWLRRVLAWWSACVEHGWLAPDASERAWSSLSLLAACPNEIARACVAAARTPQTETILICGAGTNGRLVARAVLEQGLRPIYRDDRIDSGELAADALEGIDFESMHAPLAPSRPVVVSATHDEPILSRLGSLGCQPIRWRNAMYALAATLEKELRADSVDLRLGRRPRVAVGLAGRSPAG